MRAFFFHLIFTCSGISCRHIRVARSARRHIPAFLLAVVMGICGLTSAYALEALPDSESIPLPADLSKLSFYLITVDVGDHVWDNFGHTALRMVDENSNTDTVFNWGLFDTSEGLLRFSFNFFKGVMNYQLGTFTPQSEFRNYEQQERTVWQERINLNNSQKAILYRRLMWNLRTENVVYPYDYFDDNCTTRVRDYLDEALGGKISSMTQQMTANTYRDLVLYHYRSLAAISLSLDILINSNMEKTLSEWEEMFLPLSLRARLLNIPADTAIDGEQAMLLSDSEVLMEFVPPAEQLNPYYFVAGLLLLPVALLYLLLRRIPMFYLSSRSRFGFRAPGFSFRLLGVLGLLIGLVSGIYGVIMLGGWFFSGHEDLYHNWNLLVFWPTDLLGFVIALRWLLQAKPWPMTHNSAPFINYYLFAKVVSLLVYAGVAGSGLALQSLFSLLAFLVPGLFLFTILIWMVGFELARPKHMFI